MDSNIQKYIALLSAVECGSFTRTAEKLNYSQPGISRMIRDIESEWGVTLLERNKSGVKLSSEGERLLPFIRKLCSEYADLENEIDNITGLKTGILKIGATSCVASQLLPDIILKFADEYPGITYEVKTGDYCDIEKWISEGTVDCGFISITKGAKNANAKNGKNSKCAKGAVGAMGTNGAKGAMGTNGTTCAKTDRSGISKDFENFAVHSIIRDELLAVVPANHPDGILPLEAFNGADFLLPDNDVNAEISEYIKANKLQPNIRFTSWDDGAILALVEAGFGISIMPELNVKRSAYNIKTLHLEKPAFREIALAYRSDRAVPAVVREFAKYTT